ncbi:hypothetical protein [Mesorhizobium sp. LSJC265A00]|uniref:hypothetical protein n=1 Tax=Mesorhizobium sp. LSJC265A00 TaxID=1287322 RepID=UPI0040377816
MKALTWHGKGDIRCEQVADPTTQDERDIAAESSERRYRPVIRDHPSGWPQGRARTLQNLPRQGGRLHQSRDAPARQTVLSNGPTLLSGRLHAEKARVENGQGQTRIDKPGGQFVSQ